MATHRAPKQWTLTKVETVNSFENWKENLKYVLSLDPSFAPFLVSGFTWEKKTRAAPNRGLTDDPNTVAEAVRKTAAQKVTHLELMLGQIANYCPVISRNTIVKNSTSIESIWQVIRAHYGFQSSGAHFLDLSDIKLEHGERPEDLYQRLMAFVEDNLLTPGGGISHHGDRPTEEEELTPTLENIVVLIWLKLTHPDLPKLVKQRYGTELRSRTLASIKPEISQALDTLLDEINTASDARVMRTFNTQRGQYRPQPSSKDPKRQSKPTCPLCKQAGRRSTDHLLSTCTFLPESDRRYITRTRLLAALDDLDLDDTDNTEQPPEDSTPTSRSVTLEKSSSTIQRVKVGQSPFINAYHHHVPVTVILDSGAETNMIRESVAMKLNAKLSKSNQHALQADGQSPLHVKGETRLTLSRASETFHLEALVVENLDVDILGGVPFMEVNDITIRPSKQQVILANGTSIRYDPPSRNPPQVRLTTTTLRAPSTTTVWPGDYIELSSPFSSLTDSTIAFEPHIQSPSENWPSPDIVETIDGVLRIPNNTSQPINIRKSQHIAQIAPTYVPPATTKIDQPSPNQSSSTKSQPHYKAIQTDPDHILPETVRNKFHELHQSFADTFDPNFPGYNGHVGPLKATVNMGPVEPPQRKGRLPQYSRNKLDELQSEFDRLESLGVFKRPEEVGVTVEYLNPSFLVKKPSGGHRLVTSFTEIGTYSKPQPSLMPDVDSTLRKIGLWKYLIKTDLTSAFFQIPLDKSSLKYCGVATPFRGIRVYTRSAMGMPGSETALEELMCAVLGDLIVEGCVVKIADDLYCGGDTPEELLRNWEKVLSALESSTLRLSASKTVIAPKTTSILGWKWQQGTLTEDGGCFRGDNNHPRLEMATRNPDRNQPQINRLIYL